ncbi:MAG: NAD(P)-dependent oxidoreductase [Nitrospirae bacterium]|nr:NAD(P)-dependent oxidoreductase [Nitrospirota bacterium]
MGTEAQMNFLLVGGIGYLGGRLAAYLSSRGHRVTVSTRRNMGEVPGWAVAHEIVHLELSNPADILKHLSDKDVVVYLSAPDAEAAERSPLDALRAGGEFVWNTMEALCGSIARPALLYVSTFHVYGCNAKGEIREDTVPMPVHPYALGKHLGEEVLRLFKHQKKINALCVRLSNSFGAAMGADVPCTSLVFNDLCRQAVTIRELHLRSSGTAKRNFITMEDAVRAVEYLSLFQEGWPADGVIHLGSELHFSALEVAEMIADRTLNLFGFKPRIVVPEQSMQSSQNSFRFSVDRLAKMGFTWLNRVNHEIDETLRLYAGNC